MEVCETLQYNPSQTIRDLLPNCSCWIMFPTASSDSFTSNTCEPALIREENGAPVLNLPIPVFSSKRQSTCSMLGFENRFHYRTSGPHATPMESVSDSLVSNMHSCCLLEVILEGSGCSPHVLSCTKEQIAVTHST